MKAQIIDLPNGSMRIQDVSSPSDLKKFDNVVIGNQLSKDCWEVLIDSYIGLIDFVTVRHQSTGDKFKTNFLYI
jgi:hypothetical protein